MSASSALVEPAFCTHPRYARTLGPEVADLVALAGLVADPEQRLLLDLFFAMGPDAKAIAFENGVICSRQNLKTALFEMCALGWLFLTDQRLVVWSAHEFLTAQEAFRDMQSLVDGSDWLRRRVKEIYRGTGDESIEMRSGARLIFKARTRSGGRGLTGDKVVLDEAFALKAAHLGALLPTMSARPDPQVVYGSSAGMEDSAVLRAIRDRGRKGSPSLVYVEWTDDLGGECARGDECTHAITETGCRMDDRRRWARANPAMGRRISEEHVAKERRSMPPPEFGRERLGWWDEPEDAGHELPIDLELWNELLDAKSGPDDPVAFGYDVAPNRRAAAICGAGFRPDGRIHVEVIDHRDGTEWVGDRLGELKRKWRPRGCFADRLTVDSLRADLDSHQVRPRDDESLSGVQLAAACAQLLDWCNEDKIRHRGDSGFTAALKIAVAREIEGGWVWSKRRTAGDITVLYAMTAAVHGLLMKRKRKPKIYNLASV